MKNLIQSKMPFLANTDNIESKDVLIISLLLDDDFSCLPELLDCIGQERFFKFIDIFSGVTFKIPPHENFVKKIRDTEIYIQLKKCKNSEERSLKIDDLSIIYEIDKERVRQIYSKIKARMESYNTVFGSWRSL